MDRYSLTRVMCVVSMSHHVDSVTKGKKDTAIADATNRPCLQDCGMVRDYENPTVRLPESVANGDNLNPTDEDVIETVRKPTATQQRYVVLRSTYHILSVVVQLQRGDQQG